MCAHRVVVLGVSGKKGSGKDTASDFVSHSLLTSNMGILGMEDKEETSPVRNLFAFPPLRLQFAGILRKCVPILTGGAVLASQTVSASDKARPLPLGWLGRAPEEKKRRIQQSLEMAAKAGGWPEDSVVWIRCSDHQVLTEAARILEEATASRLTVGRLLQVFGTDVGRDLVHPELWIRPIAHQLQLLSQQQKAAAAAAEEGSASGVAMAIVTDVRFPDELLFIRHQPHNVLIQIDADQRLKQPEDAAATTAPPNSHGADGRHNNHASETSLNDVPRETYDCVVQNNEGLAEFKMRIRQQVLPLLWNAVKSALQ